MGKSFIQCIIISIDSDGSSGDDDDYVEPSDNDDNNEPSKKKSKTAKKKRTSRRFIAKQRIDEFNELFAKHKHLFVMNCDLCENYPFETFYGAREHYETVHQISKGYVRCCSSKLRSRYDVKQHLLRHLNPEKLKYGFDSFCQASRRHSKYPVSIFQMQRLRQRIHK